jgi:hypothetical protein
VAASRSDIHSLATKGQAAERSTFRSQVWPGQFSPVREGFARRRCVNAWVSESWTQVASVFLFAFLPAVIFFLMVYTYYQQTIDPDHGANLQSRSVLTSRANTYRDVGYSLVGHQNTGRSTANRPRVSQRVQQARPGMRRLTLVENATSNQAAAAAGGASQQQLRRQRAFASRSLKRSHRPPPLVPSPSPFGMEVTPGPPTYRPLRVYAAFAAPLASSAFDKAV